MSRRNWNGIWWVTKDGHEVLRWRPESPYLFGDNEFIKRLWAKSEELGGSAEVAPPSTPLPFFDEDRYAMFFLCWLTVEGEDGYEFGGKVPEMSDLWLARGEEEWLSYGTKVY